MVSTSASFEGIFQTRPFYFPDMFSFSHLALLASQSRVGFAATDGFYAEPARASRLKMIG
jgi:hypothetical protein